MRESAGTNERHVFIICIPQDGGDATAASRARGRLVQLIDRARAAGLFAAGIIGDPDPYTATMNALAFFRVDDIIISTLPATRSGWLRADLVQRVQNAARKPVKHIESQATTSAAA
jgi:hypothetical protein